MKTKVLPFACVLLLVSVACTAIIPDHAATPAAVGNGDRDCRNQVAGADKPAAPFKPSTIEITIAKGDWGKTDVRALKQVLNSAAHQLLKNIPNERFRVRLLRADGDAPQTTVGETRAKPFNMLLAAEDGDWGDLSYQFAHEFAHILTNFDRRTRPRPDNEGSFEWWPGDNQWFDETLSEVASLFVLNEMAREWNTTPPRPALKGYAKNLQQLYGELYGEPERKLKNISFKAWYKKNSRLLDKEQHDRDVLGVIANQLLPLFQKEPRHWAAVRYWNNVVPEGDESFELALNNWYAKTPKAHQEFVRKIASEFGIETFDYSPLSLP